MTVTAPREGFEVEPPDVSGIVIDDGAPVDNPYSEKQMRLLTESLYASWGGPPGRDGEPEPRQFLAAANVGCFASPREPPLVPDVMLSLDVRWRSELWPDKRHMTYFVWEFGKPPDLVIEVVSNRVGGELDRKKRGYARMRVAYYVVWDPGGELGPAALHAFELRGDLYVPLKEPWFEAVGLGLTLWDGEYEGMADRWLRWCRTDGELIATGAERADVESARADAAATRVAELEARLRALGVNPEDE
ncbi:MAG: Uma2 family endonuclease [Myxococcales bacterium]|nr:Uma2 family endonuclease [Myxococcales bacterium]MCB9582045.1 Uma2 family endonuclease [Polyangiaceae bacterium]